MRDRQAIGDFLGFTASSKRNIGKESELIAVSFYTAL